MPNRIGEGWEGEWFKVNIKGYETVLFVADVFPYSGSRFIHYRIHNSYKIMKGFVLLSCTCQMQLTESRGFLSCQTR